jgi:hypothetical protein
MRTAGIPVVTSTSTSTGAPRIPTRALVAIESGIGTCCTWQRTAKVFGLLPERGDVGDERGGPTFKFTRPSDGALYRNEGAGELLALAHSNLRTGEFGKEDDAEVDAANLITVIIQETEWCKSRERCRLNLFTPLALKCGEDAAVISTDMSANTE